MPVAGIGSIGLQELLVILVILVLLFGARKIPELARGLGEGIRNFRNSLKGDDQGDSDENAGQRPKGSDGPGA